MVRKRLGTLVSIGLLIGMTVTFLTGFVAAALDLNRFVFHKYAAYVALLLAAVHVVLHWRSLVAQVRKWLLSAAPAAAPRSTTVPVTSQPQEYLTGRRRVILAPGAALMAGLALGSWSASRGAAPVLQEGEDLGQVYHQWSKPTYLGLLTKSFHPPAPPPTYKEYPGAPVIPLASPPPPGGPPLEVVLMQRRSVREYADRSLRLDELSRLLYDSTGITDRRDPSLAFRTIPSSGALFPIEVYPVLFRVAGVAPGVYHYDVQRHRLELVRPGDFRREVFQAAVSQEMVLHTSLVLVLTGVFARVQWKYVDRAYRYLLLEAGHLGQNVYLAATALGLAPCGIGAFFDDDLNRLLGVDGRDEATVYLLAVGPRA